MITWYKLRPVDTFFFKGSTPMVMGENHTSESIFPPSSETIAGAVRTATLYQQNIDFNKYGSDNFSDDSIKSAIGKAGEAPPFQIIGPVFSKDDEIYVPVPFNWYMEKSDIKPKGTVPIYRARPVESPFVMTSNGPKLYIAMGKSDELKTAGGMWININDLHSNEEKISLKSGEDFFVNEPRTGIALEQNRKVRKSHLYTFTHIRFKPDVELVFGISSKTEPLLLPKGILQLGGEKRLGSYEITDISIPDKKNDNDIFMSLSSLPCKSVDTSLLVATGRIQYRGGWDMKKNFHKPLTGFYPAGSVFLKKTNENQIPVKGE